MSQVLTVNNRNYIPAGKVGKHFGYTRDYILMLARDGRIDGMKVGHRWYVNLESAENYFSLAKEIREERKQVIRAERRAELKAHVAQNKTVRHTALPLELAALAIALIVIGVAGFSSTFNLASNSEVALTAAADASFLERIAVSVYNFISPEPQVVQHEEDVTFTVQDQSQAYTQVESDHNVASKTVKTSIVVGPGEVLTTTRAESIAESFSDEVSVSIDPHNPDAGIIIPHFKDADGEEYRYLIVPVSEESIQ